MSKDLVSKKRYKARNPDKILDLNLKRLYGISLETYKALNEVQSGKCAVCEEGPNWKSSRLCVDHDHSTGRIRGLLCRRCNALLGHAQDSISILNAAISYLNKHNRGD